MIFHKIYEMKNMEDAWKKIRSKNPAPGIDRVRVQDFEKNLDSNLKELEQEIREKTYRPKPVMVYKDRKAKGNYRTIGISVIRDRVVQQAVLNIIGPHFESRFLPCCYAYRPKKSALIAVQQAGRCIKQGKLWFMKLDIEQFFDSINHDILLNFIREVIDENPLIHLISVLLKAKIFKEMGLFDNTLGSQQGSGLSPMLSNIYLHTLDTVMWKEFKDNYMRYSDDIALFAGERENLEQGRTIIGNCLADVDLKVNPAKTSVSHLSGGIIYLGFYLDIKGKGPSRKSIEQLHKKLECLAPVRITDNIRERLKETDQQIRGWYNYYKSLKSITPPNILSLLSLVRLSKEFNENQYAKDLLRQHEVFQHRHPEICFHTGELFHELGMNARAMREYAKALETDPSMSMAKDRIRAIQNQESDIHKSIENTKMVIHHNPYFREGYERLAENYSKLGLYGFAQKASQKALELDEDSSLSFSSENLKDKTGDIQNDFPFTKADQDIFLDIFQGRTDSHGRQWIDERGKWGFIRVERPLKSKDVYKHLKGDETLAVYPVTVRDTVNFIVFDIDIAKKVILVSDKADLKEYIKKADEDIRRIKNVCTELNLTLYIEDSGYKGRHGWLFFTEEVPAAGAIGLGNEIMKKAGTPSEGMIWELFPRGKTERHKNLIKLPLGINRKNNRRCLFLDDQGIPEPDQLEFIRKIEKNDINRLRLCREKDQQEDDIEIFSGKKDEVHAPKGIREMVSRCGILNHLISKARDTNYLNHYERIALLYSLTFAGEQGNSLLHKVMGYCINYSYHRTQHYIDLRKESPISCARIMENFFELAESFCNCKFNLPPGSYPSPVLYMLNAEMESFDVKTVFSRENLPEKIESLPDTSEDKDNKDNKTEPEENSVLNFENIFSDELNDDVLSGNDIIDIPSDAIDELNNNKNGIYISESSDSNVKEPEKNLEPDVLDNYPEFNEDNKNSSTVTRINKDHPVNDLWELFLDYLSLNHESKKLNRDLVRVTRQLESIFDKSGTNILETESGSIRRIKSEDGISKWEMRC